MWGYWFGMNLAWWVFWIALIALSFAFLTPVSRRGARTSVDPIEILRRRYAAGEITTAEYDERRATLLNEGPRTAVTDRSPPVVPPVPGAPETEHRTQH